MATVVNNPSGGTSGDHGMGFFMGMIVLLVIVALLFYVGIPAIRNAANTTSAPTIQVPDQVDVNVDVPQGDQPAQ